MVQEIRRTWEEEAKPEMRDRHVSMVGWKYPPDEWAKLNVDGCMKTVDANYTMVNRAKEILSRKWEVRVQHTFRKANTAAADWLSNFGSMKCTYRRDNWIMDDPPIGLFSILYFNLTGSMLPRLF
jgi:hypothetical protein